MDADNTEMLEQVLEKIRSAQAGIEFVLEQEREIKQSVKLQHVFLTLGKVFADLKAILKANAPT